MGYNGGINKRGYYRRNHGMYSKSSYRSGEKILGSFIKGGFGLASLLLSSPTKPSSGRYRKVSSNAYSAPPIALRLPYHSVDVEFKHKMCGFFSLLCPVAGAILYICCDWWMLVAFLLTGFVELLLCLPSLTFPEDIKNGYIYDISKLEQQATSVKHILGFSKKVHIALALLNVYPIVLMVLWICGVEDTYMLKLTYDGGILGGLFVLPVTLQIMVNVVCFVTSKNAEGEVDQILRSQTKLTTTQKRPIETTQYGNTSRAKNVTITSIKKGVRDEIEKLNEVKKDLEQCRDVLAKGVTCDIVSSIVTKFENIEATTSDMLQKLEGIVDEARETYDNMSERVQMSERGERLDELADDIDSACSSVEDLVALISDSIDILENEGFEACDLDFEELIYYVNAASDSTKLVFV